MTIDFEGRLVLIGAGKMGGALLEGWLKQGLDASRLVIFDPAPSPEVHGIIRTRSLALNTDPAEIRDAAVIVVAVKPQAFDAALSGMRALRQPDSLVVSIVAGKTLASLERHFGVDAAVVRAMPNTPAAVGCGITAIIANRRVTRSTLALASSLLAAVGNVVAVESEEQMDAVTAVSGSGPAYVFYLTECLADAGRKLGLSEGLANTLARATVSGSGELMSLSGLPAAQLRQNVTSPGGTTQAALAVLMADDGLGPLLERAVAAAARRAQELAG